MKPLRPATPIAAIASAPGRGAVGLVRLSGTGLAPLAQALCGQPLKPRHAHYLTFRDAQGQPLDQGLALFFPAPHSYTGEDVLELQAHGGPVVLQLLLARCLEVGAQTNPTSGQPYAPGLRLARPGEFSERAFLNDKIDLAQAESIADLIDAGTQAAARSAARSLAGQFSEAIHQLSDALVNLRTLVEATLDFPEEDIDFLQQADAKGQLQNLQQQLAQVQARAHQGALLRDGLRVVIAGQPNVGKSSLLNALAQAQIAIVTDIPGTTRDVLRETLNLNGVPLQIIDTAGLHNSSDPVERLGMARAWEQIAQADVLLHLRDLSRAHDPAHQSSDQALLHQLAEKMPASATRLEVWNKSDLLWPTPGGAPATPHTSAEHTSAEYSSPEHSSTNHQNAVAQSPTPQSPAPHNTASQSAATKPITTLQLSAKTGQGLNELRQALLAAAGWQQASEGVFIARQRHLQALSQTTQHLAQAEQHLSPPNPALELLAEELRLAHQALMQITGEFGVEDLLGQIFGRFCIGK